MKLWEILKMIDDKEIEDGTLFIGQNIPLTLVIKYENEELIYEQIMNDKSKGNVTLCSGELSTDYKMIKPELLPIYHHETISIVNGIGCFKDDFIDSIYVYTNNNENQYEIVPIDGKFAVPKIQNGNVSVFYKKYVNARVININSNFMNIVL